MAENAIDKLFRSLDALLDSALVEELRHKYAADCAVDARRSRAKQITWQQKQVLQLLATVGRDGQQRFILYWRQGQDQAARICTYHGQVDDSTFVRVHITTLRALERRGFIARTKRVGARQNYSERYSLTDAGRRVLAGLAKNEG